MIYNETNLNDKRVAFLATDGVEQSELTEPWKAVEEAGGTPQLVSLDMGQVQAFNHNTGGDKFTVDRLVTECSAADYDALVLPGGLYSPDALRQSEQAVAFVRSFFRQQKPVAAICHGPWLLIEAGVVEGRTVTSYPSIKTDLVNAGATWVDEECVCDHGLVTSRSPEDLPAFCSKLVEEVAEGKHEEQLA